MEILNQMNSPKDLKTLKMGELKQLAKEIREVLITKINNTGGHIGPNLGMIEATIALHYVFDSPVDKIVFDVSHQCYTHKILTGRKEYFLDPEKYNEISGFTNPKESKHDIFQIGHTATSISLATGLAKARDLNKKHENIIAVIGDGSLSGGEAYEGLNNAAVLNSNMIIVVNDNDMSIAENQGGLYQNLALLRQTKGKAENNFFKTLGFDYCYIDDGHDFEELISTFQQVKDMDHPIIVHMHTTKGKGLAIAQKSKEQFHWILKGALDPKKENREIQPDYKKITRDFVLQKQEKDPTILTISPATPGATGIDQEYRQKAGKQYVDVGIAEEHAVAFASGIAANGGKPILQIHSSFLQRTYDQLSQDLALNQNPATILVFANGISGADATHLGCFDIPFLSNIPNMVYLAPTTKEEYLAMLEWSIEQTKHPVAIRVPGGEMISIGIQDTTDYGKLNQFKVEEKGTKVAIIALGSFLGLGKKVVDSLKQENEIQATLINPKYLTGIDEALLESLKQDHDLVVTLEDGALDGGFGEKITRYYGNSNMKVMNLGAKKEFTDRVAVEELYERYHLTVDQIVGKVQEIIE